MKKVLAVILICAIIIAGVWVFKLTRTKKDNNNKKDNHIEEKTNNVIEEDEIEENDIISVVPTMNDVLSKDSCWCGTFQLVWNDMKNEVVKKDVEFDPQIRMVENLNKEDFNETMISDEYYYKIYGIKNQLLKEKIEKGIQEKFNQKSDILDDFDWIEPPADQNVKKYFFYTMLYRNFEFLKEFNELENDSFAKKYNGVEYFGIDKNGNKEVRYQIDVLYYNSKDDFAILINTKTKDEVILCKNPKGNTFASIYQNMNDEADKYTGSKTFEDVDEFKAPKLTFNEKREYQELEHKEFETADPIYKHAVIEQAIQTIKFSLDQKGGEIKSEAGIALDIYTASFNEKTNKKEPRYFYVDDTFALFLREQGKENPYFAARIEDITKVQ